MGNGPQHYHPALGTMSYHPTRPRFTCAGNPASPQAGEREADLQAWFMRFRDGMTYRQIADRLGWKTESAAYKAVWRFNRRELAKHQTRAAKVRARQDAALRERLSWDEDFGERPTTYQEIANGLNYAHRASAWKACQRALERLGDRLQDMDEDQDDERD
ncbi:hypothetical protein [Gordonia amicalis]|uniref:hypothetical protein n=1 Tax=Gordonia amicalis TaxID=89053 RepID=UPI0002A65D3F|nr:hypothetical protein [Gordonia amicalis]NKX78661.1 hypothetical protein [Gordonia amicalis]GAC55543.1 hypothetical protein GOAMI_57_00100 [Gordonia amicalis NBRC 100051 = JCM 11271]